MEINSSQIASLLRRMSIFRGVPQAQIELLAENLEVFALEKGERLFSEGDFAESFLIVFAGKIRLTRERDGEEEIYATLVNGDHFGEEALMMQTLRPVSATAIEVTRLVRLSAEQFQELIDRYPQVRQRLATTIENRRLARQKNVDWLGDEETVYLFSRKDRAYLYITLVLPVLLGWFGLFIIYLTYTGENGAFSTFGEWIGGIVMVVSSLWAVWDYVDWTNDYYIVTDQRVIWLEKVIALYESRQEAPMDTVLTVGINTDFIGRILGYGDVRVKTFTGQIVMRHVGNPDYMVSLIEEFISRAKQFAQAIETAALERAIRTRLGLPVSEVEQETTFPTPTLHPPPAQTGENPFSFLIDIFKVRIEEEGVVTYRKHWLLLIKRAWAPTLALLAIGALFIARVTNIFPLFSIMTFLLLWLAVAIGILGWWIYEYVDWRNDIYQITEEHIVDIYRKPLGEVDKKTAPLENILSLHHEQTGLIRLILNYGDVVAMVGAARFTFDGVYNPAEVVQDIFLRMNARKRRQREIEAARERERIADWFAAYHRQTNGMPRREDYNNFDQISG